MNEKVKIRAVINPRLSGSYQVSRILAAKEIVKCPFVGVSPVRLYNRNVYDDAEEAGRSIFEMVHAGRDKKAEAEFEEFVDYILSLKEGSTS
ncbi:hypothetical protein QM042_01750 [Escherichia coli]|uniref:hypothetical protein n=1 Tax=Escherichia coli TaxID=562 RepID=UPI0039882D89